MRETTLNRLQMKQSLAIASALLISVSCSVCGTSLLPEESRFRFSQITQFIRQRRLQDGQDGGGVTLLDPSKYDSVEDYFQAMKLQEEKEAEADGAEEAETEESEADESEESEASEGETAEGSVGSDEGAPEEDASVAVEEQDAHQKLLDMLNEELEPDAETADAGEENEDAETEVTNETVPQGPAVDDTPQPELTNPHPVEGGLMKAASYPASHRSAWIAHGAIGAVSFGLLVPSAIGTAFFRDCMPASWIYVHVVVNVMTFATVFFAVGIAFATMGSMGDASEGHMKELHHIVGLLLLLMVSFQVANGFLRPPRVFVPEDDGDVYGDDEDRRTEGKAGGCLSARKTWHFVHGLGGMSIFGLGAYQVHSGLGLFARRYAVTDWGDVYLGYIGWVAAVLLIGKAFVMWKHMRMRAVEREVQSMRRRELDPENELTNAQFETV
mmetsp:Transcript_16332/g.36542  ORF Transcript_16332/g.36542 Transcript_16332/m.36542 type:complete len:442 (+) Transcript_16332:371-1696(+)